MPFQPIIEAESNRPFADLIITCPTFHLDVKFIQHTHTSKLLTSDTHNVPSSYSFSPSFLISTSRITDCCDLFVARRLNTIYDLNLIWINPNVPPHDHLIPPRTLLYFNDDPEYIFATMTDTRSGHVAWPLVRAALPPSPCRPWWLLRFRNWNQLNSPLCIDMSRWRFFLLCTKCTRKYNNNKQVKLNRNEITLFRPQSTTIQREKTLKGIYWTKIILSDQYCVFAGQSSSTLSAWTKQRFGFN